MRWWPRLQLMYLKLSIFKCFLNAHSRQLFGQTISLASTHRRIFRNVPDRLHIHHVSVNTNDCEERASGSFFATVGFLAAHADSCLNEFSALVSHTKGF